jgi:hypothetical protein
MKIAGVLCLFLALFSVGGSWALYATLDPGDDFSEENISEILAHPERVSEIRDRALSIGRRAVIAQQLMSTSLPLSMCGFGFIVAGATRRRSETNPS